LQKEKKQLKIHILICSNRLVNIHIYLNYYSYSNSAVRRLTAKKKTETKKNGEGRLRNKFWNIVLYNLEKRASL